MPRLEDVRIHLSPGEYYRVRMADGPVGFVFAHNLIGLIGSHMPLTATEQHTADERVAAAARPPGGWRGLVQRISRRPRQRPV